MSAHRSSWTTCPSFRFEVDPPFVCLGAARVLSGAALKLGPRQSKSFSGCERRETSVHFAAVPGILVHEAGYRVLKEVRTPARSNAVKGRRKKRKTDVVSLFLQLSRSISSRG